MGTRENILANEKARDDFFEACIRLDAANSGVTAQQVADFVRNNFPNVQMEGIDQEFSVYDLFVLWHVLAMAVITPENGGNAAHSGPVFLPWHRMYLLRLEQQMQRVLEDSDFALPYWDWAEDGELASNQQWRTDLWSAEYLGEPRNSVQSGRMAQMRVRLVQLSTFNGMVLASIEPRPIIRDAGRDDFARTLPVQQHVKETLLETEYDVFPWNTSANGHRNRLEGWGQGVPQMHNRVHVWVGGDMGPGPPQMTLFSF